MAREGDAERRLLVFVCTHGAVRSRLAAAFFNQAAPAGWWATSVGVEPQPQLGATALSLLQGTGTAEFLDRERPRRLDLRTPPDALVAIDCDLADAVAWRLDNKEIGQPMVEEVRLRVLALASSLSHG